MSPGLGSIASTSYAYARPTSAVVTGVELKKAGELPPEGIDAGNPTVQVGPFLRRPRAPATESPTLRPVPSLSPQRPTRPDPEVTSRFMLAASSGCVRAWFQMRTSSRTP